MKNLQFVKLGSIPHLLSSVPQLLSSFALLTLLLSACGGAAPEGTTNTSSAAAVKSSTSVQVSSTSAAASQASSSIAADTQSPTMPATLMLGSVTTSSVTINWSQSTDNVAVTGYQIYRDNQLLSTVGASTEMIVDSTVTANKSYLYGVKARDAAGNWSSLKTITVATPAPVSGGGSSSSIVSSVMTSSVITSSATSSKASSVVTSSASSKSASSSSSTPAVHSTTLNWIPPTQRENGDPLLTSDIGGYSIRFTSQTSGAVNLQNVSGGSTTGATVPNLTGTYTFEIATYDTAGLYSDYTLIGIK